MLWSLKPSDRRNSAICLTLLVVVATMLRFHGLDRWSLWLDELLQYRESATPLKELYSTLYAQDVPISFLLGHALVSLGFDNNEWQLRLPFAIFGVVTVAVVYFLARELLGPRTAFLAGLVACVMPVLVVYSQEYRAYSLLVFLTTLSAWSLTVALRTNAAGWWALFVGTAILGAYTHFVGLFSVAGLAVFTACYVLLKLRRREPIRQIVWSSVLAFAIVGIAFIPAIPMFARLLGAEEKLSQFVPASIRLNFIGPLLLIYPGFQGILGTIIAAVAGIGIVWTAIRSPRTLFFLLGTIVIPALLYAFFGYERATFSPRYTLIVMPPYAVAIGAGLAAIASGIEALVRHMRPGSTRAGAVTTGALAVLFVVGSLSSLSNVYSVSPKQLPVDVREGFETLRSRVGPDDLVLEASTNKGGSVYWFPSYESYYLRQTVSPKPLVKGIVDDLNFPNGFTNFLSMHGRLWVIITVSEAQQSILSERSQTDFEVQCFRRICVIQSRQPERPMLEQLAAFFDRFADIDPKYFAASADAVRAKLNADRSPR